MAATPTTIDERIFAGLPPASADDLFAAVSQGTLPRLKWALAHRAAFADLAVSRRVDLAVTDFAASADARGLVELAGALRLHHPDAFLEPRVRGAIHLALELDELGPRELFFLLQPLLADDARFDAYVRHGEQRPLGARLRVAAIARGVALAATFVGSLAAVVPGERGDAFERVVQVLYRDRDPSVGLRAAWAAGALAARSERMARLALGQGAAAGLAARRQMVARTARWILGEEDDDRYLEELLHGSARSDVFVRWSAIRAMELGARIAPETCADAAEPLVAGAPPEVLAAIADLARALPDEARRASLLAKVSAEAKDEHLANDRALRFVLGPRAPAADAMRSELEALRAAASASPRTAHAASEALLATVRGAIASIGTLDATQADDVDQALEHVLFDAPILRDALIASAVDDDERVRRYRAWAQAVSALAAPRLARCEAEGDPGELRDRLRRLGRALDAHPRKDAAGAQAPSAPNAPAPALLESFLATCQRVATSLLARADAPAKGAAGAIDRPLAVTLAAAVEPLVAYGRLHAAELVAAMLRAPPSSLAKHLAASVTSEPVCRALGAMAALGGASGEEAKPSGDKARRAANERALAERVANAAHDLATALLALGAESHAAQAAAAVDEAIQATWRAAAGTLDAPLVGLWLDAVEKLDRATRGAAERFALSAPAALPATLERALYSALSAEKLVPVVASERPFGAARAASILAKSLPPPLARLLDVLLAGARAARHEASRPSLDARRSTTGIAPGKRIGDYVVEKVLGSGGMGHCVLVRRRLETQKGARQWVLKIPQREEYVEAFRNEALALLFLAKAGHPAIVRFVSYVDYGFRLPFLVMEYVQGEALDHRLARGPLPHAEVRALAWRLADGMAKSHSMSVCHHDIKPGNVVLAAGEGGAPRPVLVDWGLAGAAYPWAGTPEYMAPERFDFARGTIAKARAAVLPAPADVWALGCVLAEMCSGRPFVCEPLTKDDVGDHAHILAGYESLDPQFKRSYACEALAKNPPLLRRRLDRALEGAPAALNEVVRAMLETKPDLRPTADEIARRLKEPRDAG